MCALNGPQGMMGYQYDGNGNRVGKGSVTTMATCDITQNGYQPLVDYVLDQGGSQMAEMLIMNNTPMWIHTNVTANGTLIAALDNTGFGTHFFLNDALGTRRVQTDAAGIPEQNCQSLPFGDRLYCTGSTETPTEHHFTGKERDRESGLDYFPARYFGSAMGRFMTPDPSGLVYANPFDPQSFNLYSYVRNNPLRNIDPLGLDCVHINNDTGAFISANRGDCDNSTEESANTGHYFDGKLSTLYTSDGTLNGAVTGLGGTDENGGYLFSGGPGKMTPQSADNPIAAVDAPTDQPLSPYARAVFGGVAQRTAWFPTVCSVGVFGYAGRGQEAFGVKYFRGAITEYDSSSGKSVGGLFEAGAGTVGGGYVATANDASVLGFKELGEVPFVGDAGAVGFQDVGGRPGVGLYAERASGSYERGVGAYASVGTIGQCH